MAKLPLILLAVYAVIFVMTILNARKTPGTVEPNTGETTDNIDDLKPVSYDEIMDCERPWIGGYN